MGIRQENELRERIELLEDALMSTYHAVRGECPEDVPKIVMEQLVGVFVQCLNCDEMHRITSADWLCEDCTESEAE